MQSFPQFIISKILTSYTNYNHRRKNIWMHLKNHDTKTLVLNPIHRAYNIKHKIKAYAHEIMCQESHSHKCTLRSLKICTS